MGARAPKNVVVPEELQQYLEWARKKADWYDPFINASDEFLKDADKEVIEQPAEKKTSGSGFGGFGSSMNESYHPGQSWYGN